MEKIDSVDLTYMDLPVPFAIRSLTEVAKEHGSIADRPHRHNYYSVIWFGQASGKHIIDFKEYPIESNQLYFVSPHQVHQILTDPGPIGHIILFTPEFLARNGIREDFISDLRIFSDSDENPPLPLNEGLRAKLKPFVDGMTTAVHSDLSMKYEIVGAYLKLFLIECTHQCSLFKETNTQQVEVGKTLVHRFKSTVEDHFHEWHQVQEYAETLNVSPNYLNEVIRNSLQRPAKDYIQNRIILEAKRMAVFTELSVKEIGFRLGFEDPSHFSKVFKTQTGHSFIEFKEFARQ